MLRVAEPPALDPRFHCRPVFSARHAQGFTLDGPLIRGTNAVQALWLWLTTGVAQNYVDKCLLGTFFPPCGHKCPLKP